MLAGRGLILLCATVGALFTVQGANATVYSPEQFVYLGTSSYAAAQPTANGKRITTLYPWNNKIYIGYGDYAANTGPIHITYYDPKDNQIVEPATHFLADTEAIYNYRSFDGVNYALSIDPRDNLYNELFSRGEPWNDSKTYIQPAIGSTIDAEHVFDMASLQTPNGPDLWAVGSAYTNYSGMRTSNTGAVWRSTDGGNHWAKVLDEGPLDDTISESTDFTRFYFAGVLNNKLYVQAIDAVSHRIHPLEVFDPATNQWSKSSSTILNPSALPGDRIGWRPIQFTTSTGKQVLVLSGNMRDVRTVGHLYYFDGNSSVEISHFLVSDFAVYQGYVIALASSGAVMYSTDLVNWQVYAVAPSTAQSVAVSDATLYIGTTDSKIYSLPFTATSPVTRSSG